MAFVEPAWDPNDAPLLVPKFSRQKTDQPPAAVSATPSDVRPTPAISTTPKFIHAE
jgi:hypothetical protein